MTKDFQRGFTIFFAVLVGSLALAIGLSIYELLIRELELSQVAKQSQFAIYAADAGAECALYWDSRYNGTGSAFSTSTTFADVNSGVTCATLSTGATYDIAADGWNTAITGLSNVNNPPTLRSASELPATAWPGWHKLEDSNSATTTFLLLLGNPPVYTSPCAKVQVVKRPDSPGEPPRTTITSRGYNTCADTGLVRVERAFQVSY